MIQDDFLLSASQKSADESAESMLTQNKQSGSWLSRIFSFNCCKTNSPVGSNIQNLRKKSMNTVATHYSSAGPDSFMHGPLTSTLSSATLSSPCNSFPLDVVFLLGKETNRIISKISKVNLGLKLPLPSAIVENS